VWPLAIQKFYSNSECINYIILRIENAQRAHPLNTKKLSHLNHVSQNSFIINEALCQHSTMNLWCAELQCCKNTVVNRNLCRTHDLFAKSPMLLSQRKLTSSYGQALPPKAIRCSSSHGLSKNHAWPEALSSFTQFLPMLGIKLIDNILFTAKIWNNC